MEHAGFLADIVAHPEDDTPRLVYADWLDDDGQPDRAEFIRLQLRLASLPETDPDYPPFYRREQQLLARYGFEWAWPLVELLAPLEESDPVRWDWTEHLTFRRGFVDGVVLWKAPFLPIADRLFALAPLRDLRLTAFDEGWEGLAACPHLRRLRALRLSAADEEGAAEALAFFAGCPSLAALERLHVGGLVYTEDADEALARQRAIVQSPHLANLTALVQGGNGLGDIDVGRWLEAFRLPRLTELGVAGSLNDATALFTSPHLPPLTALALPEGDLDLRAEDIEALANCPRLAGLRTLDLGYSKVGPGLAFHLARSPHLRCLTSLDVHCGYIGREGARLLLGSPVVADLTRLDVRFNEVGDEGVRALVQHPDLRSLRHLDLGGNEITPGGADLLCGWRGLDGLATLDLGYNRLGTEGVRRLVSSPGIAGLTTLRIADNHLGAGVMDALIGSPHLGDVVRLDLASIVHLDRLDEADRRRLREHFGPRVKV